MKTYAAVWGICVIATMSHAHQDHGVWHQHTTCHIKSHVDAGIGNHEWHLHYGSADHGYPSNWWTQPENAECYRQHQGWRGTPGHGGTDPVNPNDELPTPHLNQHKDAWTKKSAPVVYHYPRVTTRAQPTSEPKTPILEEQPIEDEETEMEAPSILPLQMSYTHVFPKGVSLQHIPLDTEHRYVGDVYDALGNSVDQVIASRGVSGWTHIRRQGLTGGYIGKGIGFITVMNEAAELELTGTFDSWIGGRQPYHISYLRDGGLTLKGFPIKNKQWETVGDLKKRFRNVTSIRGIAADLEVEVDDRVNDDWFEELGDDTVIEPTRSYLISAEGQQRAVWGYPWAYEPQPPAAAPPAVQWQHYRTMAMTWGSVKRGVVDDISRLKSN